MKSKTKFKHLLLLLLVFTFSTAITFGQSCGDINANGSTDIIDALLVAQCYVGLTSCPSAVIGDVNCDGSIDIIDGLLIAQLYVGLISTLNCCGETPIPTPITTPTATPDIWYAYEFEAEDATWNDAAVESEHTGYTGSGYVNTANSEGVWIEWTIYVDRDCNAVCVFRYANSGLDRPVDLSVNGDVITSLSFPDTGGWTSWSSQSAGIILSAGSNAIRLTATSSNGAANMDRMDFTISSGVLVTPTATPVGTPDPTPTSISNDCAPPSGGNAVNHGVKLVGYGSGTTGGGGSNKKTVSSSSALSSALKSNTTIYVNGTISGSGMIQIKDQSNISVIGVGSSGKFRGVGLSFIRTSNIIIQNLYFESCSEDGLNIENTDQVWIDHNTFSTSVNYLDCDQGSVKDQFDGQIDIKKNSQNITVSFNYVHDACKAMLLGWSDGKDPDNHVTYHHNRFENVGSRLPLIRSADTHVYNNYYKNVLISGINVRMGANALIENNYFDNVDDPILSADSSQIGYWNVSGNLYAPNGPQYTHSIEKQDVIGTVENCEVKSTSSWKVNYSYQLDDTIDVPPTAIQHAGAGKM